MNQRLTHYLSLLAIPLAFLVITLGAYTRLTDAGLGCPDWPGCYGQMVLPSNQQERTAAQQEYPDRPIEAAKAWTEMIHRYAAGTLIIMVLTLTLRTHRVYPRAHRMACAVLLLICGQAVLGMWTVTWKLLPWVVCAHLLGGMLLLTGLLQIYLRLPALTSTPKTKHERIGNHTDNSSAKSRPWLWLGCAIILFQIFLGGWVSANYAGLACVGFPSCNGSWWPHTDWTHAFHIPWNIHIDYQGGQLASPARVTIQMVHRLGALLTWSYITTLSIVLYVRAQSPSIKKWSLVLLFLVTLQCILGIINVIYLLPLPNAVAHNGIAALLLITCSALLTRTKSLL
ncbi:MAG: COX15/CtaA family protein [Legionellaceae bacterium]|nr:COX15/CtaA family protein [Legionellaceae bacterium]